MWFPMVLVRIRGDCSTECSAQRAAQDSAIATADFVTYSCAGCASEAAAYSGVQS
jgi:hypothetical protein